MEVTNFKNFIEKVNNDLGQDFCKDFAYKRKNLKKAKRCSSKGKLFICNNEKQWSINSGGGVEVQYHIGLDSNRIVYGIGFNTQYVPFCNNKSTIDYMKPYTQAFLSDELKSLVTEMEKKGFEYIYQTKEDMYDIKDDEYYLFGKKINLENNNINDNEYNNMITDLKIDLFNLYLKVFAISNKFTNIEINILELELELVIRDLLKNNYNLILTGAPGTGKTYLAKEIVKSLIKGDRKDIKDEQLNEEVKKQMGFVQFHPSYDYTDFVEGIRPKKDSNGFERVDGIFKEFCKKAIEDKTNKYYFIIDEINRGDLNKILGELFYSLDMGYRGEKGKVKTQYQNMIEDGDVFQEGFYIPENVYIIGTMNDIDRSVDSMDFAIRRRFAWKEITAEDTAGSILENLENKDEIINRMINLNKAISNIAGLNSMYHIGASYFLKLEKYNYDYEKLWDNHLKGLLYEYLRGKKDIVNLIKELKDAYDNESQPTENNG